MEAPEPQNITQLRAFLGVVNYYAKFVKQISTVASLYKLLEQKTTWSWEKPQKQAFKLANARLTSSGVLTHFDPHKKVILSSDVSPYGIGAVISHEMKDGESPIAFASRSLSVAEKKYAHLDREGLAIIFGVKSFTTTSSEDGLEYVQTTSH